jgi:hypothetical protein
MLRILVTMIGAAALYGCSIGAVHSPGFARNNLLKFPLLLLVTAAICALAYWVVARAITPRLGFGAVQRLVLETFRDLAVLLAALAPACFFLACTIEQPDGRGLHDYPLFLGLNVLFIAVAGTFALVRQAQRLLLRCGLTRAKRAAIVIAWLALSLLVGSQWAWFLRPFCGVSSLEEETPFVLGAAPDFRGATSFYQAVYQIFDPPPLADGYYRPR